MKQLGFFDLSDHLKRLSETGDPLETMARVIDFEAFRPELEAALSYSDGSKGGRPPYDAVAMFKVLILAAQHNVSDERMEFLIRDRLSWLRFLGFDLGRPTPDENTIRSFRERLTEAGAIRRLFEDFDRRLRGAGYLAMGGQIVDATLVSAPRQWNTAAEKAAIKAGKSAAEIWPETPAKAAQKDVDARWTVKIGRPRDKDAARSVPELAIPVFGYKNHVAIDRRFGFIRSFAVTDAARHDGALLREVVTTNNTASDVWADTAYRSQANEAWLESRGRVSRIHRKKPKGRPMSECTRRANAVKSAVRARVEHVFAHQKDRMGLFVRTVGKVRAEAKIGLVNLAYNFQRLIFHERRAATG
ncbi:MAG: IS5 family transposase [Rhodospirillales bacterium]|jgi:IS5 family transposase|nr:IS5 family transposase [Rhodospirillales bacterium]